MFSWFLGGDGYGPDGQIDEVEMQAQATPLAQDQRGASIWCDEAEDDEAEAETETGKTKSRAAGAAAEEEEEGPSSLR